MSQESCLRGYLANVMRVNTPPIGRIKFHAPLLGSSRRGYVALQGAFLAGPTSSKPAGGDLVFIGDPNNGEPNAVGSTSSGGKCMKWIAARAVQWRERDDLLGNRMAYMPD